MKALIVEPKKAPVRVEILNTYEGLKKIVGGSFEEIYPYDEDVALICNDLGKELGLPLNRSIRDAAGRVYDIIAGTFVVCGAPLECEDYVDLTEEQFERYERLFRRRECFYKQEDIPWKRWDEEAQPPTSCLTAETILRKWKR